MHPICKTYFPEHTVSSVVSFRLLNKGLGPPAEGPGPPAEGPGAARTVRATANRRRRGARGGGQLNWMGIHGITIQSPNIPNISDKAPTDNTNPKNIRQEPDLQRSLTIPNAILNTIKPQYYLTSILFNINYQYY